MKQLITLTIVSLVFFVGCEANNAGDGHHCTGADISRGTTTYMGESYSTITDQAGLQAIFNDLTAHYILCNDIRLNDTFAQINPDGDTPSTNGFQGSVFTGILEGNHKTILELEIRAQDRYFVGLFGAIAANGEVRNLHISLADLGVNPSISGNAYVGALAGENRGTITNVRVTGGSVKGTNTNISTNTNIGGLVGYNSGGTITNSAATSSVEGLNQLGGLVGYNSSTGTITLSYATGTVEGTDKNIGGLVGYNLGTIEYSHAAGKVEGSRDTGGLVGFSSGTITASYAAGKVEGSQTTGGLVGSSSGTITASYFDATTTGQSDTSIQGVTAYYTNPADGKVYTEAGDAGDLINEDDHFPEWDFDTIWAWQGDGQWPLLQFQ